MRHRPPEHGDFAADGVTPPHVTRLPRQPTKGTIAGADVGTRFHSVGLLCRNVWIIQAEEYDRLVVGAVIHHLKKKYEYWNHYKKFRHIIYEKSR